jgi:DNA-binding Lrp family transcriptional regulator
MKEKLDLKDKKLLRELEKNCRASNSILGKKVNLSADSIKYRLKKLEELGIIKAYLTYIDFSKINLTNFGIYVVTNFETEEEEAKFVEYIVNHQNITYFSKIGGSFNYIIGILAENPIVCNAFINSFNEKLGNVLEEYKIAIRLNLTHFPKDYLYSKPEKLENLPTFGGEIINENLDEIDKKILKVFTLNCRAHIVKLSQEINLPYTTFIDRLKKLEKRKIITSYFPLINSGLYGYQTYNILIKTKAVSKENEKKLFSYCSSEPNLTWIIQTFGEWNYEIGAEVQNQEKLEEILKEIKKNFGDIIINIQFIIIFKNLKYNQYPFK